MLVDSHCHLDAAEFGGASAAVAQQAADAGVRWIVVPAVEAANFETVASLAASLPQCVYALGIHPMYVRQAADDDLKLLRERVAAALDDPRFVGIGDGHDLASGDLRGEHGCVSRAHDARADHSDPDGHFRSPELGESP